MAQRKIIYHLHYVTVITERRCQTDDVASGRHCSAVKKAQRYNGVRFSTAGREHKLIRPCRQLLACGLLCLCVRVETLDLVSNVTLVLGP